MSIWWSLQLRREAASVPLARRLLRGTMESAGVDADTAHELSVALTEACANAVQHGGSGGSQVYRVTASIDGDMCRIEVSDSGPGFPLVPHTPRPEEEHGRGLSLIRALADRVHFHNRSGTGGAVVTFDKHLKRPAEVLLRAS